MARAAKPTKIAKPIATGRKLGRLAAAAAKTPAKVTRSAAVAKRAAAVAAPAPKLSKDELRAQVDKLERTNAMLRAKNKETGRATKTAAARVAELEQQMARLEAKLRSEVVPGSRTAG